MVDRLLHRDGLFLGGPSGLKVRAAVQVARDPGPGHTVVTVLCDSGARYQSRLFDPSWLVGKGLQAPDLTSIREYAEYASRPCDRTGRSRRVGMQPLIV